MIIHKLCYKSKDFFHKESVFCCFFRLRRECLQPPSLSTLQVQIKDSETPVVLDVASAGGEPALTIAKVGGRSRESFHVGWVAHEATESCNDRGAKH